MKHDRFFYTGCGAMFLVLTVLGFRNYIFGGRLFDGAPIKPAMLAAIVAHSSAVFAWFLLFFVQSLLISMKNRRVHMKLGWSVLVIALLIAVTGPIVAVRSTRIENASVFDWPAENFLLIMLTEIVLYVVFVAIGVLNRKRPRIHRPMMLLASLSLISGATGRIPVVNSIFGFHQWMALFAPVVVLGGLCLLVRWLMTRSFEREFAVGYGALIVVSFVVSRLAMTDVWVGLAGVMAR
jgi:ABC-type multidrug transport system fused ATPase/permease subunit